MSSLRSRGLVSRPGAIVGALGLLTVTVLAGSQIGVIVVAGAILGFFVGSLMSRVAANWTWLVYGLAAIDLLIPEDDRYTLHGSGKLGFELEPYRVVLTLMIVGWVAALMVDPRVRARKTKFEGPLLLIWFAIIGSEAFNPGRVAAVQSAVTKALILALSLTLFLYVVVSVVRKRETIDRLLQVLVASGCVVALGAVIERETKFNIFNHLHSVLPMFSFNLAAELAGLLRNGHFRALASAGHPIELANEMAMLTPLAAYLAIRGRKLWWMALPILLLANLSSGSRTGIVGLLAVVAVFLRLRPRQTFRCWPALIPVILVLAVLMPGALSGAINAFFPKGGLIAQQSATFANKGQVQDGSRLSRIGPQLTNVFAKHNEFFGEGYGTRIVGRISTGAPGVTLASGQILDDQWLGNLLETGFLGLIGWIWLFTRVVRRLGARALRERDTTDGWLPVALAAAITCYAVSMYLYDAASFMQGTILMYVLLGCASSLLWLPVTKRVGAAETPRLYHVRLPSRAISVPDTVGRGG